MPISFQMYYGFHRIFELLDKKDYNIIVARMHKMGFKVLLTCICILDYRACMTRIGYMGCRGIRACKR